MTIFLEQADVESLKRFAARSVKAKTSIIEARDTVNPALITQMLMPLLEAIESSIDVPRLEKRVRNDVNIENAEFSWKKLPFWLILRVAIQRYLCITLENETERACYKFFICTVLAHLLENCYDQLASKLTIMLNAKLCRRLAKLKIDKNQTSFVFPVYNQLFDSIDPLFKEIIKKATKHVELTWVNFKKAIIQRVPKLPSRVDEQALRLSLLNNEKHLFDVLTLLHAKRAGPASLEIPSFDDEAIEKFQSFTDGYFSLAWMKRKYL